MLWASNVIRPNFCQSIVTCSMSSISSASNGTTISNISSINSFHKQNLRLRGRSLFMLGGGGGEMLGMSNFLCPPIRVNNY